MVVLGIGQSSNQISADRMGAAIPLFVLKVTQESGDLLPPITAAAASGAEPVALVRSSKVADPGDKAESKGPFWDDVTKSNRRVRLSSAATGPELTTSRPPKNSRRSHWSKQASSVRVRWHRDLPVTARCRHQ